MINRPVLVLNQNFEPLSVCGVKRAVILMYLGKAETIETVDGYVLRSELQEIPVPSIVRLDYYVKVPGKRIMLTRKNILKRDGSRCQYCGGKEENLVCSCADCNNKKGHQLPEQAGLRLIRKPRKPNNITFIQQFIGIKDHRWKRYLFME